MRNHFGIILQDQVKLERLKSLNVPEAEFAWKHDIVETHSVAVKTRNRQKETDGRKQSTSLVPKKPEGL